MTDKPSKVDELLAKSPRTPKEQHVLRQALDAEQKFEAEHPGYEPKQPKAPEPEPEPIDSYNPPMSKAEKKAKAADAELGNG